MSRKRLACLGATLLLPVAALASVTCPTLQDVRNAQFVIVPEINPHTTEQSMTHQFMAAAQLQTVDLTGGKHTWTATIGVLNASDINDAQNKLNRIRHNMTVVNTDALTNDDLPKMYRSNLVAYTCYLDTPLAKDSHIFLKAIDYKIKMIAGNKETVV